MDECEIQARLVLAVSGMHGSAAPDAVDELAIRTTLAKETADPRSRVHGQDPASLSRPAHGRERPRTAARPHAPTRAVRRPVRRLLTGLTTTPTPGRTPPPGRTQRGRRPRTGSAWSGCSRIRTASTWARCGPGFRAC